MDPYRARQMLRAVAVVLPIGGLVAGIVCFVHTSEPGCPGWVGCGTSHPLVGIGIGLVVVGVVLGTILALVVSATGKGRN